MKTSKTTRERAILWWQKLASVDKYTMDKKYKLGPLELWTEENIEAMYLSEHPTQPEQTIKEEWQIDKDGVGNLCVWKNKTKIAAVHNNNYDIANLIASAPRLAKENKELKEENKLVREALEIIITSPEWIKNYGGGAVDKKAKSALNQ